ncbi:MAG: phosphatase PAP2 family protein [Bryobacteraceae bacterium]
MRDRPRADIRIFGVAMLLTGIVVALAWLERTVDQQGFSIARDWTALGLVLVAYRTLDLFSPGHYQGTLELSLQRADHFLLEGWHLRQAIESCGAVLPAYLETAYFLTSGTGCYALTILYLYRKRDRCDCFLLIYVLGTLLSYALVPFLRLEPPRIAFPGSDMPQISTAMRKLNLVVLSGAGIHSGVFPSAHVSSTFSAAWGMFIALPERKMYGWIFLIYATSVALATVYGRYHYAADTVAGFAVSVIAVFLSRLIFRGSKGR